MKLILYIHLFLLTVSITNCSNSTRIDQEENPIKIIGKWKVQAVNFYGTEEEFRQADSINFYNFFGATLWSNAEDKSFEFRKDGLLDTDMIPNKLRDKVKMSYTFNEDINVRVNMASDSTSYEFKIVIDKLDTDMMVWKFGNYMEVKLTKIGGN